MLVLIGGRLTEISTKQSHFASINPTICQKTNLLKKSEKFVGNSLLNRFKFQKVVGDFKFWFSETLN